MLYILLIASMSALTQADKAEVYTSSADLKKKMQKTSIPLSEAIEANPTIVVDEKKTYQTILGFGGTYSEATSYNLKRVNAKTHNEIISAFFHPRKGAGWTMLRTTINSCDASSEYYSYCEKTDDSLLASFSIEKDIDNYMIPGLQQIVKVQPSVKIFASPWTPPVWMKSSKEFNKGYLLEKYYSSWALYFSKYLAAYKKNGINIWSVTPQNEPAAWEQKWDACGWSPGAMKNFVQNHLGPQLAKDFPSLKLMAFDHNKNFMLNWLDTLLGHTESARYFGSIAHHWYEEGEAKNFEPLQEAKRRYPDLPLIASEQGVFGLYLLKPEPAELYARDIIGNMNNGTAAWIVWGMAFDHEGGPNHTGNFNHSPIMVDVKRNSIYYNPSFYYIAHFSRFVKPGAKRINFVNNSNTLLVTAFKNQNGRKVLVIQNITGKKEEFKIKDRNRIMSLSIGSHSIMTIIY